MARQAEKVFLINLDRSVDRLSLMQQQFDRLGMHVERLPGAEGLNIPAWLRAEFKGPHLLAPGEVGCYASHLMVAHKVVAEELPYAVVLEDDTILDDDFAATCADAIRHAPDGWDLVHLSAASSTKRPIVGVADLPRGRALVRYLKYPWTAAAYIISNRGARKCLAPMERVRPIDWVNSYPWMQGLNEFGVHPAPARQRPGVASEIGFCRLDERRNFSPGLLSILYGAWWTTRQIGPGTYLRARTTILLNSLRRRLGGRPRVVVIGALAKSHAQEHAPT
jgi:glycosyl transferase, family 25